MKSDLRLDRDVTKAEQGIPVVAESGLAHEPSVTLREGDPVIRPLSIPHKAGGFEPRQRRSNLGSRKMIKALDQFMYHRRTIVSIKKGDRIVPLFESFHGVTTPLAPDYVVPAWVSEGVTVDKSTLDQRVQRSRKQFVSRVGHPGEATQPI